VVELKGEEETYQEGVLLPLREIRINPWIPDPSFA